MMTKEEIYNYKKEWRINDKIKHPEKYIKSIFRRGKHPNSRKGSPFIVGHKKMGNCGAPKGSHNSPKTEFKVGQTSFNKGKKASIETRKKQSIAKLNKPAPWKSGKNCPFWKGGITTENAKIRTGIKYKLWRSKIFERDNYTCKCCGKIGGNLNAHHIKSFSQILEDNNIKTLEEALSCEELWNINNGTTLCKECHKKTENYGKKSRKKLNRDM